MRIFAVEASGQVAGCALWEDDHLVADYNVRSSMTDLRKTHSQSLLPMMEEIKAQTGLDLATVDAVATSSGPGSFTGLRIGAATAKGLALALERPIIPVPTLEAIAGNLYAAKELVCPVMDARRSQVYTALYRWDETGTRLRCEKEAAALSLEELVADLLARRESVTFLGDAVPLYGEKLRDALPTARFAPGHLSVQRAASVAARAYAHFLEEQEACFVAADAFRPLYLRRSQAERETGILVAADPEEGVAAGRAGAKEAPYDLRPTPGEES